MAGRVMDAAVAEMLASSTELLRVVPSYDHLFMGPKLTLPLCTKHLVGWPSKKALGTGCLALDQAMKKGASLYIMWGLGGVLEHEAPYKGDMEAVVKNYISAQKGLATIAGVNCLVNLTGQEKIDKKTKLLRQVELLPKLLAEHLNKIR